VKRCYVCSGCGREFSSKARLREHQDYSPKGSLAVLDLRCNPDFRNRRPGEVVRDLVRDESGI
jgi:hypothetical protein